MLDRVADGLQDLYGSNVPVLFRLLHEMNGIWFWWVAGTRRCSTNCGRTCSTT
jgi:beta-mannanase